MAKRAPTSIQSLKTTAEKLGEATQKLIELIADAEKAGVKELLLPWSQHRYDCFDVVITACDESETAGKKEITAKLQKRPTAGEKLIARRAKRPKKD